MKGKVKRITKEEFCNATHTSPDSWLFQNQNERSRFWVTTLEGREDRYYYEDGNGTSHRFKDMPELGEIYHSVRKLFEEDSRWSIWSTWCQYD